MLELIVLLVALAFVAYYVWAFYDERQRKLEQRLAKLEKKKQRNS